MSDYWLEVHGEDLRDFLEYESGGVRKRVSKIEGKIYEYLHIHGAKIMVAEADNRIVGFMVYHLIFECVLICLGVYFIPAYQKAARLRSIICSPSSKIKKVISQTYKSKQPNNIRGEKDTRKVVAEMGELIVWENEVLRPR